MGAFLLGLIIGIIATLFFVIYDEGEAFLKLHGLVKRSITRFKQADTTPRMN